MRVDREAKSVVYGYAHCNSHQRILELAPTRIAGEQHCYRWSVMSSPESTRRLR